MSSKAMILFEKIAVFFLSNSLFIISLLIFLLFPFYVSEGVLIAISFISLIGLVSAFNTAHQIRQKAIDVLLSRGPDKISEHNYESLITFQHFLRRYVNKSKGRFYLEVLIAIGAILFLIEHSSTGLLAIMILLLGFNLYLRFNSKKEWVRSLMFLESYGFRGGDNTSFSMKSNKKIEDRFKKAVSLEKKWRN